MVRIEATYLGELRTKTRHAPSGAEFVTDAPKDNQGRGESFSPTDLVGTALGTCMLTTMGIVAKRSGWWMEGARVSVEKHMIADPARRIARLVVEISLPAALSLEARRALEAAAHGCPVHRSLHPGTAVEVTFVYLDPDPGRTGAAGSRARG